MRGWKRYTRYHSKPRGYSAARVYVSLPVRIVQYLRDFELTAELVEKKQHLFALVIGYTAELVIRRAIGGEF